MLTKTDIEQYFLAEKNASLLLLIVGIAGIVAGIVFLLILKTSFYKGSAIITIAIGLLQIFIGYSIYGKTDGQRTDMVYAFDMNPDKLKSLELPRIQKAVSGIQVFLLVEAVLLVSGAIIYLKTRQPETAFWQGLALLLVIESLILLGTDLLALKRNQTYLQKLQQFTQSR